MCNMERFRVHATTHCFRAPFLPSPLPPSLSSPSLSSLSLPSSQVHETEKMLTNWMQRVAELRSQYDWLLFFSVPKLLLVYHLLQEGNVEAIVHEISFLCSNEQDAWKSAQVEVQVRAEREGG